MTQTRVGRSAALVVMALLLAGCSAGVAAGPPDRSPAGATSPAATVGCDWRYTPASLAVQPGMDVALVPEATVAATGTAVLTLTTSRGLITMSVDRSATPCTAASLAFLVRTHFYDGTSCQRLDAAVVGCGDRAGTTGPGYEFPDENARSGRYHAGDVVMGHTATGATGSRILIISRDVSLPTAYPLWGRVTGGLGLIQEFAAAARPRAPLTVMTARLS